MKVYDRQLPLLRRRLLLALRHQKAYMDSLYIEYTGEDIEVNVRPSLPFKLENNIHGTADVDFKGAHLCSSMPTKFAEEYIGAGFDANVGNPLVTDFSAAADITVNCTPHIDVGFLEPTPVKAQDGLRANVVFSSNIDPVPLRAIGKAEVDITPDSFGVTAKLGNIEMQKVYIDDLAFGASFTSSAEVIKLPEMSMDLRFAGGMGDGVKIGLYQLATLERLGDATLDFWANMPLDTGYVTNTTPPVFAAARP